MFTWFYVNITGFLHNTAFQNGIDELDGRSRIGIVIINHIGRRHINGGIPLLFPHLFHRFGGTFIFIKDRQCTVNGTGISDHRNDTFSRGILDVFHRHEVHGVFHRKIQGILIQFDRNDTVGLCDILRDKSY